jgi:hypothetical protein
MRPKHHEMQTCLRFRAVRRDQRKTTDVKRFRNHADNRETHCANRAHNDPVFEIIRRCTCGARKNRAAARPYDFEALGEWRRRASEFRKGERPGIFDFPHFVTKLPARCEWPVAIGGEARGARVRCMSALGQKRTLPPHFRMSALPQIADVRIDRAAFGIVAPAVWRYSPRPAVPHCA